MTLDVGASPSDLQSGKSFDAVPFRLDGKIGPGDSRAGTGDGGRGPAGAAAPRHAGGDGAGARLAAGAGAHRQGDGHRARGGRDPAGEGRASLDYQQARTQLRAALASVNGGTLDIDGSADLDLSYPAIRRGVHAQAAPFQAKAVARQFDLAFPHRVHQRAAQGRRDAGAGRPGERKARGAPGPGEARVEGRAPRARRLRGVPPDASAGQRHQRPHLARRSPGVHRVRLAEGQRARDAGGRCGR